MIDRGGDVVSVLSIALALSFPQAVSSGAADYVLAHRAADEALVAGRLDEARSGFERCLTLAPNNATVAYALACSYARAGDIAVALEWLERAATWGYVDADLALWDEDLARIRSDPRFDLVLSRMRERAPKADGKRAPAVVRIWDKQSEEYVADACIDASGQLLAAALADGTIRIHDARSGAELRRSPKLGSEAWVVAFHPEGSEVAVLTWSGDLHFWPIDSTAAPAGLRAVGEPGDERWGWPFGAFVQFDPTGKRLLVGARDRGASLWTADGELIHAWSDPFGHFFSVDLAWSHDGERIATTTKNEVRFFNGRTGEPADEPLECPAETHCVAFQPGGSLLATGHEDKSLRIWNLEKRELLHTIVIPDLFDTDRYVNAVAFSPDGNFVAASSGSYINAIVVESESGKTLFHHDSGGGRMGEPYELRWAPDSRRVWCGFTSGVMGLAVIDTETRSDRWLGTGGRPPRMSPSGLGAIPYGSSLTVIDTQLDRLLWCRPMLGREGELVHAPTGHFTATIENFAGLEIAFSGERDDRCALAEVAVELFDPKRVRAARAGVALTMP